MELQAAIVRPLGVFLSEVLFARRFFAGLSVVAIQSAVCCCFAIPLSYFSVSGAKWASASNVDVETSGTNTNVPGSVDDQTGCSAMRLWIHLLLAILPLQTVLYLLFSFTCNYERIVSFPTFGIWLSQLVIKKRWLLIAAFCVLQHLYTPYLVKVLFSNIFITYDCLVSLCRLAMWSYTIVFFAAYFCCGESAMHFELSASQRSLFARMRTSTKRVVLHAPFRTACLTLLVFATYATLVPIFSKSPDMEIEDGDYTVVPEDGYFDPLFGSYSLLARTGNALVSFVALFFTLLFLELTFQLNRVVYQTVFSHYLRIEERVVDGSQAPLKLELSSSLNSAGFSTRLPWTVQAICIDKPLLFKYLAMLDLRVLSETSEIRRAILFGRLSYDSSARLVEDVLAGDDPRIAWNALLTECVSHWRSLTLRLQQFSERHSALAKVFGDLEYPYFALLQSNEQPDVMATAVHYSESAAALQSPLESQIESRFPFLRRFNLGNFADSESPFRALLKAYFVNWTNTLWTAATRFRLTASFVNTSPALAAHSMLTQAQSILHCWMVESVMNLAIASYDEDMYGVVQCRLGELLNTLFDLHASLTVNLQLTGPYRFQSHRNAVARFFFHSLFPIEVDPSLSIAASVNLDSRLALRDAIESALRSFAQKFEQNLTDIQNLNPEYANELQRSVSTSKRTDPNHNRLVTNSLPTWTSRLYASLNEETTCERQSQPWRSNDVPR